MHKGHCRPTTPPAMMQRCYGAGIEAERVGGDSAGSPGRKHGPSRSSGHSVFQSPPDCRLRRNRLRLGARSMTHRPIRRNHPRLGAWSMPHRPIRRNHPRLGARSMTHRPIRRNHLRLGARSMTHRPLRRSCPHLDILLRRACGAVILPPPCGRPEGSAPSPGGMPCKNSRCYETRTAPPRRSAPGRSSAEARPRATPSCG